MNKIKLVYWDEYPNFGDALSPFIVGFLSKKEVIFKDTYLGLFPFIKQVIKSLIGLNFGRLKSIQYPYERTLIAIGSMIRYGNPRTIIWGAGFMNRDEPFHGGTVYAVRGKYTQMRLINMGYESIEVLGDPALLLPLILPPVKAKKIDVGIIPHCSETDYFIKTYGERYEVIDLRTRDIENVVNKITNCNYILSTSLHGIIVAHSYGIPALWIKKGYISTDGIKFLDYFTSVDIPEYEGFSNLDEILYSTSNIRTLFEEHTELILPHKSIDRIQQDLLDCAPFIKDKK